MRRFIAPLLLVGVTAFSARAQSTTATASVSGVVRDSIAHRPLAAAIVQLVASDPNARFARTVTADSLGHFVIDGVPDGRYALGFFHPILDSLGVEAPVRDVTVTRQGAVRLDLALPSAGKLRAAYCGASAGASGAALIGVVRDAKHRQPIAGVTVVGEWLEFTFRREGIDRTRPRLMATTGENGAFVMCNVPSAGTMFLSATRGADSTDVVDVEVPAEGFQRRDLYIGPARMVASGDSTSRPRHAGDGQLHGTVVSAEGGRPLGGAVVRVIDGPQVLANDRGGWTLTNAPSGTRMLEVRAVGYYPLRQAVDITAEAPPVKLALATFKSVLDTVKITSARIADRWMTGFDDRRRSGMGKYYTADDLARRGAMEISDIFKNIPGVQLVDDSLKIRSAFNLTPGGDGNYKCAPDVIYNGHNLYQLAASEIDQLTNIKNIRAIEVYNDGTVPIQFQRGLNGCGAILIWAK